MDQYARDLLFVFRNNRPALVGLVIVVLIALLALLAPVIAPFGPEEPTRVSSGPATGRIDRLEAPSSTHWLGTDQNGFDIFSRIIYAPRVDLLIAVSGTLLAIGLGTVPGLLAGFYGGRISDLIMRVSDVFQAFPLLILALLLVSATGGGIVNVIFVIGLLNAPIYLRLIRSQVLSLRETTFVEAATSVGNSNWRIVSRHVLPSAIPPVLTQSAVNIGFAIGVVGALAFIGVGVPPATAEWGVMINIGSRTIISGQWWGALFPGIAMAITILGFNLIAEALQEALNPSQGAAMPARRGAWRRGVLAAWRTLLRVPGSRWATRS